MKILKATLLTLFLALGSVSLMAQFPGGPPPGGRRPPRGAVPPHMQQQQNNQNMYQLRRTVRSNHSGID